MYAFVENPQVDVPIKPKIGEMELQLLSANQDVFMVTAYNLFL